MIVADIGNTNIQFAFVKCAKITKISKAPIKEITESFIRKKILTNKKQKIIICSVVPQITRLFSKTIKNLFIVGKNIKIPIKSLYQKKDIGNDRLLAAYAANTFFPQTRIILDFGTAITLDFISKNGIYQGGIILPGVGSTIETFSRCALLPKKITLVRSTKKIPQNTAASISKGLQEGFSMMINSLVEKYCKDLKISNNKKILITGGGISPIINKLSFSYQYEPLLILKGLIHLATNRARKDKTLS